MSFRRMSLVLGLVLFEGAAQACDLCAIHSAYERERPLAGSFHLGVNEQYSVQGRVQQDGKRLFPNMDQELRSSTTQFIAAYDFSNQLSMQVSLPWVTRRFKRFEAGEIEKGNETGIGDASVIVRGESSFVDDGDLQVNGHMFLGVKLPTGDSDRIGEEALEGVQELGLHLKHGDEEHEEEIASAVHGHDLALGSGSVDYPIGLGVDFGLGRNFVRTKAHYTVRSEGDFDYRYGNDFIWGVGIGRMVCVIHEASVSFAVNLSGEYKPEDRSGGIKADDTYLRASYWGPEVSFNASNAVNGYFGVDFPIDVENSGTQTVMSQRFKGGVLVRF